MQSIITGIDCAKDDTCSGFLWQSDDSVVKVPITALFVWLINPHFRLRWPSHGYVAFNKPSPSLEKTIREKATRLGFNKEIQFDVGSQTLTRYYKVYQHPQKTHSHILEKECLTSDGILPVANLSEPGFRKMYETLALDTDYLMIGLRRHFVQGETFRLTWSTGQILGEGTLAELDTVLADIGFKNTQTSADHSMVYGYITGKLTFFLLPSNQSVLLLVPVGTGEIGFVNNHGAVVTFLCEFTGSEDLAAGKKVIDVLGKDWDPPCKFLQVDLIQYLPKFLRFHMSNFVIGSPEHITLLEWYTTGENGYHQDGGPEPGLLLIDLEKNICLQTVIAQGRDYAQDRLHGLTVYLDQQIPKLVRSQGFVSPTVQLCGSATLKGSVGRQLFFVPCTKFAFGRYLGIQVHGVNGPALFRIGAYAFIEYP